MGIITRGEDMNQKVSGEERLAAICQALRQETLSPAQQEAEALILAAKREAETLLEQAKKEIDELKKGAKKEIEKEKMLFHSSLRHASNQIVDSLKEQLENTLFQKGMDSLIHEQIKSPEQTASLLTVLTKMIEAEGLTASPEIWVGKAIDKKAYLSALATYALNHPFEKELRIGSFSYGCKLVVKDRHMSIEVTEESMRDLLSSVLRRDFRKYLFKEQSEETNVEGTKETTNE